VVELLWALAIINSSLAKIFIIILVLFFVVVEYITEKFCYIIFCTTKLIKKKVSLNII
jgi:hypothetical protein